MKIAPGFETGQAENKKAKQKKKQSKKKKQGFVQQRLCNPLALGANLFVTPDGGQQEQSAEDALLLVMWLQKRFLDGRSVEQCSDS